MATIARNDLHGDGAIGNITNVHDLAFYSRIESLTPTIAVPGIPAKWSPPNRIKRLPKDSGLIYISQNAARHPDSPLEPLFRAFTGHHRIVSYCLGGMRLMVRCEVDGYVDEDCSLPARNKTMRDEADLSTLLGNMSLSTTHDLFPVKAATKLPGSKLTIRQEGKEVPIESTLEIKTRVAHKPLSITDVASQLWFSQTPKLVRAYHRKGMFQLPQVEDVTMELKDWKRSHQIVLNKFVFLLENILKAVKGIDGRAVVEYNPTADSMVVRGVEGKPMLLEDLYDRWRYSDLEESAQSEETIEQQRDD
ncbi:hypothetical protein PG991_006738 [Apiospora marii]|uniref:Geranylgeranyl pyrophosphate synthetase n=1 Tax=Apiospora marii TaxID=335849 RepID=A0ABR1RY47_9PEZI